jgi:VIT1/CCC1 family predicted Fe2+/Mn2+ transporter
MSESAKLASPRPEDMKTILAAQRNELTEYHIYRRLARLSATQHNRDLLERIGEDELAHHDFWAEHTGDYPQPNRWMIWRHVLTARLFGLTFALKLMERGEQGAQSIYAGLEHIQGVARITQDEEAHEHALIGLLHDERLDYTGSVVLGLNDALVELTGVLAGLTLALADARMVAVAGLITGIAASLSMAASEYLSFKEANADAAAAAHPGAEAHSSGDAQNPLKAAAYTGAAYLVTVALLILPFFLVPNLLGALAVTLVTAVAIIALFTFYTAVAKDQPFWSRFLEMSAISLGVATLSFGIGWLAQRLLGVSV